MLLRHTYKNTHLSFSPKKSVTLILAFVTKATDFQVKRVHVQFLPLVSCVEHGGVFSSALEVREGMCCSSGKLGFATAPSWQKGQ